MAADYARINNSLIFHRGFHLAPPQESIDHRQGFLHQENLVRKVPTVSPEVTNESKDGGDQEGKLSPLKEKGKNFRRGTGGQYLPFLQDNQPIHQVHHALDRMGDHDHGFPGAP